MAIKHANTVVANEVVASAYWNADHTFAQTDIDHAQITNTHNLTTNLTPAWANISDKPSSTVANIDDAVSKKHARSHVITGTSDHTSTATSGQMLKADANGLPVDATNTDAAVSAAVTASHARSHAITGTSDHTSGATAAYILKADANGLPTTATNTDAEVADAVTKKHASNADTALGSDCAALDHVTAATDTVGNYCYGTGDPPAANTTTEGALFIKYTA